MSLHLDELVYIFHHKIESKFSDGESPLLIIKVVRNCIISSLFYIGNIFSLSLMDFKYLIVHDGFHTRNLTDLNIFRIKAVHVIG